MSDWNDIQRRKNAIIRQNIRDNMGNPTARETGLPCPEVGDKLRRDLDKAVYKVTKVESRTHNNHDDDGNVIGKIDIPHLFFSADKNPKYTMEDDFDDDFWATRWQRDKLPGSRLVV